MTATIVTEADAQPYDRTRIEADAEAIIRFVLPHVGASFTGLPPDREPNPYRIAGSLWERVGERDADAPRDPHNRVGIISLIRDGERRSVLDGWVHPPTHSHILWRAYPRSSANLLTAQR